MERAIRAGVIVSIIFCSLNLIGVMNYSSGMSLRTPPPVNSLFGVAVGMGTVEYAASSMPFDQPQPTAGASVFLLALLVEFAFCMAVILTLEPRGGLSDPAMARMSGGGLGAIMALLAWPVLILAGFELGVFGGLLGVFFGGVHGLLVCMAGEYFSRQSG